MTQPLRLFPTDRDLTPHKTLRLAPAMDVPLTDEEIDCIDTPEFQRLHGIKQLGTAYKVYPSAVHTRFEHSLGTLSMAQALVEMVNRNPLNKDEGAHVITEDQRRLIRLAALLHDIPHVPFGHTLEDESRLLDKHDTRSRFEVFLAPGTRIGEILGEETTALVIDILSAKTDEEIKQLPFPFAADMVGNTICADLLDYIRRDMYYTGLMKTYDARFLMYFYIPSEGPAANRLVLNVTKKGELRRDVVSEVIDLLRLRYSLAEKVLYHRAKISAGAMISRAFQDSGMSPSMLDGIGDEVFLDRLGSSSNEVSERIILKFRGRQLYKLVFLANYGPAVAARAQIRLADEYCEDFDGRRASENRIADLVGLPRGAVLIHCPHPSMLMKEALVKVRWAADDIRSLSQVEEDPVRTSVDSILADHRALWKFWVFLDPEFVRKEQAVADVCYEEVVHGQVQNDIARLRHRARDIFRDRVHEFSTGHGLTARQEDNLYEGAARGDYNLTDEELERRWKDISSSD